MLFLQFAGKSCAWILGGGDSLCDWPHSASALLQIHPPAGLLSRNSSGDVQGWEKWHLNPHTSSEAVSADAVQLGLVSCVAKLLAFHLQSHLEVMHCKNLYQIIN